MTKFIMFERSKHGLAIIIVLAMLLAIVPGPRGVYAAVPAFSGAGAGTASDPYRITSWTQLHEVRNHLTSHFKLMNNLGPSDEGYASIAGSDADSGKGWEPIGKYNDGFRGRFDGNGKTINGLYINRPTQSGIGLFAYTGYWLNTVGPTVEITKVHLRDVNITGKGEIGGLAGWGEHVIISNSSVTGNITGSGSNVAGFVGYLRGEITTSYADANVTGYNFVGGLVGDIANATHKISNSYSKGTVHITRVSTDVGEVGGLVGGSYGIIDKCYTASIVTGSVKFLGYLVGFQGNVGSVTNSFYDGTLVGAPPYDAGYGWKGPNIATHHAYATTTQMKSKSTFTAKGWDFDNIWAIDEGTSYPYFKPDLIKVSFDMIDETVKSPSPKYYEPDTSLTYGSDLPDSKFERPGYTFKGWNTKADGSGVDITSSSNLYIGADHILYAKWEGDPITVSFDKNGGSADPSPSKIETSVGAVYGELPASPGTKAGYEFDGWSTGKTGTMRVTGDSAINIPYSHTLYARWQGKTYTISFDASGGNITPASIEVVNGKVYGSLPSPGEKSDGDTTYWFDGWYTAESGGDLVTGETILDTASETPSLNLYARWSIATAHTITYDGNGSTSGTVPVDTNTYLPGLSVTVAGIIDNGNLGRTGHTFKGWGTNSKGAVEYNANNNDQFSMPNRDVTLFAVWQPDDVEVTFNPQITGAAITTSSIAFGSQYLNNNIFKSTKHEGYDLLGWFTAKVDAIASGWNASFKKWQVSTLDKVYQVSDTATLTNPESHTLYAQWAPKIFDITFNPNGGSVDGSGVDAVTGATAIYGFKYGQLKNATRQGYEFDGWYTAPDGGGSKILSTDTVNITTDSAFYANWIARNDTPYKVAHYLQKTTGEEYSPDPESYIIRTGTSGATATVGAITAQSYTGFTENTGKRALSGTILGDGSLALGFYYDRQVFQVQFENNGGEGATSAAIRYDSTLAHLTQPAKNGYRFGGWYKDAALTIPWNLDADTITTTTALYAKWTVPSSGRKPVTDGGFDPKNGPIKNDVPILINGKEEAIGTTQETKQGDQMVTTFKVAPAKLEDLLNKEGPGAILTIPFDSSSDIVVGQLDGQMLGNMEAKEAAVMLKTPEASYLVPASVIDIDSISLQVGPEVQLKDIQIQIEVSQSTEATANTVESAAKAYGFEPIGQPFDFKITYTSGDKTGEVKQFTSFLKRSITLPQGINPNRITTGLIVEPDGFSYHVPTTVIKLSENQYIAEIHSLTNSTYTVVWHPLEFDDVTKHWARTDVNDMGSRMVIDGIGNNLFQPDRSITRAEFATAMVRALGLKPGILGSKFKDVRDDKWYADYIATSSHYGIVKGYTDGTFRPDGKISRQEAMVVIAQAMELTKPGVGLPSNADKILSAFKDKSNVANWAKDKAAKCVATGVVSGRDGDRIAPKENITRAEAAAMVRRLLINSDLINK